MAKVEKIRTNRLPTRAILDEAIDATPEEPTKAPRGFWDFWDPKTKEASHRIGWVYIWILVILCFLIIVGLFGSWGSMSIPETAEVVLADNTYVLTKEDLRHPRKDMFKCISPKGGATRAQWDRLTREFRNFNSWNCSGRYDGDVYTDSYRARDGRNYQTAFQDFVLFCSAEEGPRQIRGRVWPEYARERNPKNLTKKEREAAKGEVMKEGAKTHLAQINGEDAE